MLRVNSTSTQDVTRENAVEEHQDDLPITESSCNINIERSPEIVREINYNYCKDHTRSFSETQNSHDVEDGGDIADFRDNNSDLNDNPIEKADDVIQTLKRKLNNTKTKLKLKNKRIKTLEEEVEKLKSFNFEIQERALQRNNSGNQVMLSILNF